VGPAAAAAQRANVFLAYSRKDQQQARQLISPLERLGISVWWDVASIPIGASWEEFLSDQVSAAQCVIVLWSEASLQSKWVLFEAEAAVRRGVFLPVLIDTVDLPPPFNRFQAALLDHWDGNESDPAFQRLLAAILRFIETPPAAPQDTRTHKESQRSVERRAEDLFQRRRAGRDGSAASSARTQSAQRICHRARRS
jgi:TIR domain-containing protein